VIARLFYRLALWAVFPLIWLYLLKRGRKQPAYKHNWGERLGFYPQAKLQGAIWLHAVSVGETRAAQPVVKALQAHYPDARILMTCMTPTGRETARELFGDSVEIVFLPYDYPGAVARFLAHFQPRFGVLMETEIWPNLIAACHARKIPLVLANARLSEKSLRGYLRIAPLIRPAMAQLTLTLAQSEADADRLRKLGALQVEVMGNVKFDNLPPEDKVLLGKGWRQRFGERPVLLLASSRDGEEGLFFDALKRASPPADLLVLLVPRHPQRFDEVAGMLAERGLRVLRRSQWPGDDVPGAVQVLLGDSMGEMAAWFASADVTVMGGSILPFGSQNLIESCAVGTPVVVGPSVFNFAQAAHEALALGAARQGRDADDVVQIALGLLADPVARLIMAQSGMAFSAAHRGATARLLEKLG
jgi:3-deoxy-D-manno-octulosonic-acid transferase